MNPVRTVCELEMCGIAGDTIFPCHPVGGIMRFGMVFLFLVACGNDTQPPFQPAPDHSTSSVSEKENAPSASSAWSHFGQPFTLESTVPAGPVLTTPENHMDGPIRISGTISDVCQKKGCWMVVSDGESHMRILMKDHSFAVDKDASGKACEVEGTITVQEKDPATIAHYQSEGNPSAPVPELSDPQALDYRLVATSVRIKNAPL